jgi:hypothetical protein
MANTEEKQKEKTKPTLDQQIESIRQAGQIAKLKVYKDFISRIGQGEKLSPTELKTFHQMEREIENISSSENGNGEVEQGVLISSFAKAAEYCGVSARTISYHVKRGNIKQNTDGTFERSVLDGYLKRTGRRSGADGGLGTRTEQKKEKAELRFRVARARREEMLVDQLKGNLMSQKEVAVEWGKRVNNVTSALENLADRLSPMLEGKRRSEINKILKIEIHLLREGYAESGEYCPEN